MRSRCALAAIAVLGAVTAGCQPTPTDARTTIYYSPYPEARLWAVAPLRNESGTGFIDTARFADQLARQLQQIEGIDVLPVNRTLDAMAALEMQGPVESVDEAMALVATLGVDGLIVGSVSAWEPYDPPKIGAAIQLYGADPGPAAGAIDPRDVTRAPSDTALPATAAPSQPVNQVAGFYDAANGSVRHRLRDYAHGRSPVDSPAGWRRYVMSMDLYSEFVSYALTHRLMAAEAARLRPPAPPADDNEEP